MTSLLVYAMSLMAGGQGKEQVVVIHGQQVCGSASKPGRAGMPPETWTVAVAKRVVGDLGRRGRPAAQHMPPRAALRHGGGGHGP